MCWIESKTTLHLAVTASATTCRGGVGVEGPVVGEGEAEEASAMAMVPAATTTHHMLQVARVGLAQMQWATGARRVRVVATQTEVAAVAVVLMGLAMGAREEDTVGVGVRGVDGEHPVEAQLSTMCPAAAQRQLPSLPLLDFPLLFTHIKSRCFFLFSLSFSLFGFKHRKKN